MSSTITITLLMFAAISFAGAGVAYAVGRARELADFTPDLAMRTVATLLMIFGATCAYLATGFTTILAFGAVSPIGVVTDIAVDGGLEGSAALGSVTNLFQPGVVAEPGSVLFLVAGLAGLAWRRRQSRPV